MTYRVLLADPPWKFITRSETRQTRAASNHYATMSLDRIKALPIAEMANENCALFLWAINPMIPQALEVIAAWGFTYRSVAFTWAKRTVTMKKWHFGMGYWTRQNTESCLMATIGKPKRLSKGVRQLIVEPVREHSRKPDRIHTDIASLVPGPYCELFARQRFPGWDTAYSLEEDKWPINESATNDTSGTSSAVPVLPT